MTIGDMKVDVVADVRALLDDRAALHRQLDTQFRMALPTEKLRHAFDNPPEGTSGAAVLAAMHDAHDALITIVMAALDMESDKTPSKKPTRFPSGGAFDDDFREPKIEGDGSD